MSCLNCQAEMSNGLALCERCRATASVDLEFLPVYFRNLARWRPGRAGSRPVPGSRVLYDGETRGSGTGDKISDRLDETANALTTWARLLTDDRPHLARLLDRLATARAEERVDEAQAVGWLCRGFDRHLTTVATLGWAGEFVRDLGHYEELLRGLTEQSIPGWYAGACRHCKLATYVVPGLTWVTCGGCGATTYARDHLDTVLDEAREWVASPKRLAEAVVAMVDTEQSIEGLRKRIAIWGSREKIEVHRPHDYALKRYRLGDVLDLLLAKGATRTDLLPAEADAC